MNPACEDDRHGAEEQGGHPEGGQPRTGLGEESISRLRRVAECVAGMEACLATRSLIPGSTFADALVEAATALLDDLDRTLDTDPAWDAELISTLRVYRNAGFMFRKLASTDGRGDPGTEAVCATLIEQGHDHVRALVAQISAPTDRPTGPRSPRAQDIPDARLADALDPRGTLRRRAPASEVQSPRPGER